MDKRNWKVDEDLLPEAIALIGSIAAAAILVLFFLPKGAN